MCIRAHACTKVAPMLYQYTFLASVYTYANDCLPYRSGGQCEACLLSILHHNACSGLDQQSSKHWKQAQSTPALSNPEFYGSVPFAVDLQGGICLHWCVHGEAVFCLLRFFEIKKVWAFYYTLWLVTPWIVTHCQVLVWCDHEQMFE